MKFLLALLVIGIWGLLLRPLFTATPAQAQAGRGSFPTILMKTETARETLYVFLSRGKAHHQGVPSRYPKRLQAVESA